MPGCLTLTKLHQLFKRVPHRILLRLLLLLLLLPLLLPLVLLLPVPRPCPAAVPPASRVIYIMNSQAKIVTACQLSNNFVKYHQSEMFA